MATSPTKQRGSNHQPPLQRDHARPGKRVKRLTQELKRLYGWGKLGAERRSAVAVLVSPL